MSYVLNKMADDKFTSILSQDFTPDSEVPLDGPAENQACGPMGPAGIPGAGPGVGLGAGKPKVIIIDDQKDEGVIPMAFEANEKTAGMFWNKDASKAVVDNLLRDVVGMNKSVCCDTGRKLEKGQVPDDKHAGLPEKPSTLKPEQTPDGSSTIKTDMVAKSKGAVQKEAGSKKGPGIPDGTGPGKDSPKCKVNKEEKEEKEASLEDIKKKKKEQEDVRVKKDLEALKKAKKSEKKASEDDAEKKEEEAEELVEEAQEDLEEAQEGLGEAKEKLEEAKEEEKEAAVSSVFAGIELTASMDECELDAAEAAKLSRLLE
jgi:hypothetical protein